MDLAPPLEHAEAQRRTLTVLSASTVASRGAFSALFTVAALAIKEMLSSSTWAGLSTVATTVGAAASAAALSSFMERRGRTPGLTLGYSASIVGGIIAILGIERQSLPIFLAGLVFVGVGQGTANLSRYAAADLSSEERRSRDISVVIFASTAGAVGGPLLVGFAAGAGESIGWNQRSGPIALGTILFAVAAAIIWFFLRPDPLAVAGRLGAQASGPPKSFRSAIPVILESPMARLALTSLVISQMVMVMVMAMTPLHMEDHGHELGVIGAVISAHTAGMFAFAPFAGWVADSVGRVKAIAIGGFVLVAATIVTGFAVDAPNVLMFPGLFLLGLGWSFGIVAGSALLTESVAVEHRVSVQGAADLAMNLASGSGALASGIVFESAGFHILSLLGMAAAAGLLLHGFWEYRLDRIRVAEAAL